MTLQMDDSYNERVYLAANPDIAEAVNQRQFASGREHYDKFGEREGRIASVHQYVLHQATQISLLKRDIAQRDGQIVDLNQAYAEALRTIEEMRGSSSWSVTSPMRFVSSKAKNIASLIKLLPQIIHLGGGVVVTVKKGRRVFASEGWAGIKRRILLVAHGRYAGSPESINNQNDYGEWVR